MQISFFLVMKRREETCLGAMPCPNSFLDQKIHSGLITEGGALIQCREPIFLDENTMNPARHVNYE
jgi:hypothetical protein